MARVKLTEYKAKQLILGNSYRGVSLRLPAQAGTGERATLPKGERFVVKVDQGVKKRMKQGLVALDVAADDIEKQMEEWSTKGFTQFLVEPMFTHEASDERYLSLERVRDGIRILYAREGGIDIEAHPEAVTQLLLRDEKDILTFLRMSECPDAFFRRLINVFNEQFFAFLEINPLVVVGGAAVPLDAAALVDSAGAHFVQGRWSESDVVKEKNTHEAERAVEALAATTPASLKLTVMNPNGSLFFLLSGGGGSIVIVDQAELRGMGGQIGNYGEYSGGPTREETYLYAKEVLTLLLASKAAKKALIIAGGVANFTDIKQTFAGVIDALSEVAEQLRRQGVKVFVRRGGPNEKEGLAHMEAFLKQEKLFGSVRSSADVITAAVDDAISFIKTA